MSSQNLSLPPLASLNQPPSAEQVHYNFNNSVMLAAMLILGIVVLFVLSLHIYAKWFWRPRNAALPVSNTRGGTRWRHRRREQSLANPTAVDETLVPTICIGLDSATINSLPTFIYQPSSMKPDATEPLLDCAVCLSEFQPYEKGRLLPSCKHSFHIGCIDMWFRSQSTCPLCRAPVWPWTPHRHAQSIPSQSVSTASPYTQGFFSALPSRPHGLNEQTRSHSPLQDAPSTPATSDCSHAQSISITPPHPLLQCNSGVQLQEQVQESLAKNDKLTWEFSMQAKSQASLQSSNVDGTRGSSSSSSTSLEIRGQVESGAAIGRCQSLGIPRCQSEGIEAISSPQQIKSRSFRMSIKRLLSRELSRGSWGRVFPTTAGVTREEQEQEEQSSVSSSSPV